MVYTSDCVDFRSGCTGCNEYGIDQWCLGDVWAGEMLWIHEIYS